MSTGGRGPRIGVLALQGDVREHARMLEALGASVSLVRRPTELAAVDGLVLPGGESGVIDRLARITGLREPLREAIAGGLPVLGTCAGMILLADRLLDGTPGQETFGVSMRPLAAMPSAARATPSRRTWRSPPWVRPRCGPPSSALR